VQRRRVQVLPFCVKLICELHGLGQQLLALALVQDLFVMNQQDVFHKVISERSQN
jgi:hypothetical protein